MAKFHIPLAIMIPAMALLAVSCTESNEEPAPDSVTGKEIRFAASTEYSRAGDITAPTLQPSTSTRIPAPEMPPNRSWTM